MPVLRFAVAVGPCARSDRTYRQTAQELRLAARIGGIMSEGGEILSSGCKGSLSFWDDKNVESATKPVNKSSASSLETEEKSSGENLLLTKQAIKTLEYSRLHNIELKDLRMIRYHLHRALNLLGIPTKEYW